MRTSRGRGAFALIRVNGIYFSLLRFISAVSLEIW
jgi:hypothetical protein